MWSPRELPTSPVDWKVVFPFSRNSTPTAAMASTTMGITSQRLPRSSSAEMIFKPHAAAVSITPMVEFTVISVADSSTQRSTRRRLRRSRRNSSVNRAISSGSANISGSVKKPQLRSSTMPNICQRMPMADWHTSSRSSWDMGT